MMSTKKTNFNISKKTMGKKEDCDVVVFIKKGLRRVYEKNIRKKSEFFFK